MIYSSFILPLLHSWSIRLSHPQKNLWSFDLKTLWKQNIVLIPFLSPVVGWYATETEQLKTLGGGKSYTTNATYNTCIASETVKNPVTQATYLIFAMANFKRDYFPFICLPGRLNRIIDDLLQLKLAVAVDTATQAWFKLLERFCKSQRLGAGERGTRRAGLRKGNPPALPELWARINNVLGPI